MHEPNEQTIEDLQNGLIHYYNNPLDFVIDILKVEPTEQQTQVLEQLPIAIKEGKGIAVKSGHGVGKTSLESWILLWFIMTRPFPRIPCTAPTHRQLYDILWTELAKWHSNSIAKDFFIWEKTHYRNKAHPDNWFAVTVSANKPENMQGFHAENLLFLIEEASGVASVIMEAVEGSQTQEGALVAMFGNPTQLSGAFHDAFHKKRKYYYTFTFNAEESPLVSKRWCEERAEKFGRDSDFYRVRVLGEFPKAEKDTLISLDVVEKAAQREMPVPDPAQYELVELGVDVARFGNNETVIFSRIGEVMRLERAFRKRDLMTVTGEVAKVAHKYKHKTVYINVDDSGMGGGVTDRLKEMVANRTLKAEIIPVNNGSSAIDKDRFVNLGTEMWFFMKEWLNTGSIPDDDELIGQLSTRKYKISSTGKDALEPKESMKHSPDRADAAVLSLRSLIYKSRDRGGRAYAG